MKTIRYRGNEKSGGEGGISVLVRADCQFLSRLMWFRLPSLFFFSSCPWRFRNVFFEGFEFAGEVIAGSEKIEGDVEGIQYPGSRDAWG